MFAPPTKIAWEEVYEVDNCHGHDPIPASFEARSSVTVTVSNTNQVTTTITADPSMIPKIGKLLSKVSLEPHL